MEKIKFNSPHITGKEIEYIKHTIENKSLSGNGDFTKKCHNFFENRFNFKKTFLSTSCTDALEMCAILADIKAGDEVIIPSYTFVSTALAFVRQGAKIVFIDSKLDHPALNEILLESLITDKTKAIVPVHYAGVACDMDVIMSLAYKYKLLVIEDAAQAIDSYYKGKPLGGIGHMGVFSFHETKNISCGEGGLLIINDDKFAARAEIIWEKGTNRAEFFRGERNKYGWVDTGSSFLPSEILSAFLYAQLEGIDVIQNKRRLIWETYGDLLESDNNFRLPFIPKYATNNGHMFYIICKDLAFRTKLMQYLKANNVFAVFHYQALHDSQFIKSQNLESTPAQNLPNSLMFSDHLLRLPFYFDLSEIDIQYICKLIQEFSNNYNT
jgi:dTDP-4-amino-4,6-dideoxygalactose transaminase